MKNLLYNINSDMSKDLLSCRIMNLGEKCIKIDEISKCNDILNQ